MKYLIVDAALSGTGIRDKYEGGYLELGDLGLSAVLTSRLRAWVARYEDEHYSGFQDSGVVDALDREGQEIALMMRDELVDVKMEYYSAARLGRTIIE